MMPRVDEEQSPLSIAALEISQMDQQKGTVRDFNHDSNVTRGCNISEYFHGATNNHCTWKKYLEPL
jgi:hypothetical protein